MLPFPWATALLILACWLTTLPIYFNRRLYLVLGVGNEEYSVVSIARWKHLTTPFIHGGGPPGTTAHLLINSTLFLVLGVLTERLLGAGRFSLVTLTSLAVQVALQELFFPRWGHGASGMTWSYGLFIAVLLAWAARSARWRTLRDPFVWVVGLLMVFWVLGMIKHWHLWNVLVSVPFFLVWRNVLGRNLRALASGQRLDTWTRCANAAGVGATALLCLGTLGCTIAGLLGWLPEPPIVRDP